MELPDRILFTAFDTNLAAGLAVVLGALLLPLPAILGGREDSGHGAAYAAFGGVWLGCVAAAAIGNYPTPVVGYGGSAILGYLLSLSALPRRAAQPAPSARAAKTGANGRGELSKRALAA